MAIIFYTFDVVYIYLEMLHTCSFKINTKCTSMGMSLDCSPHLTHTHLMHIHLIYVQASYICTSIHSTQVVHCWSLYLKTVHVFFKLFLCYVCLCVSIHVEGLPPLQSRNLIHVYCRCLYLQTLHAHHLLHTCIF